MGILKLGVVGTGLAFWDLHWPALQSLQDEVQIHFVAARHAESAAATASRLTRAGAERPGSGSVEELLAGEIDAVLVAVPIAETAGMTRRVLETGRHAIVEKPLSTSSAEAADLVAEAERRSLALLAGENVRLQPEFRRIKELVDRGTIGDARLYFLNDLHFTPADGKYANTRWRIEGRHRGGYLVDGGTHIVAGMREMVGRKVERVHALTSAVQPYLANQVDTLLLNLRFADGVIGHLALGYGVFDPESRHPKVYGTEGTLGLMDEGIFRFHATGTEKVAERSGVKGFAEEWRLFLDALASGDHAECQRLSLESVEDLRVIETGLSSAAMGVALSPHSD